MTSRPIRPRCWDECWDGDSRWALRFGDLLEAHGTDAVADEAEIETTAHAITFVGVAWWEEHLQRLQRHRG